MTHATTAVKAFVALYGAKWPKATAEAATDPTSGAPTASDQPVTTAA
jgi:hypothetical protein